MAKRTNTPAQQPKRAPRVAQVPAGTMQAAQAATAQAQTATAQALAAMAATLVAQPAPAAPAPATPAPTIALRGGPAVQAVHLTAAPYRVAAAHNQAWWATVQQTVAAGGGTATVAALLAAGVPAPFVGYTLRRGHLAAGPKA